jgi:hypothetical protein
VGRYTAGHEDHAVEGELAHHLLGDDHVPLVDGVEGATEDSYAHPRLT